MNRSLPSLVAGALLVLVLALYMVTYQVRFTQVAVVKTFGRSVPPTYGEGGKIVAKGDVIDGAEEAGLYWKWPWPIQQVAVYDNRIQLTTNLGEETPTRDGKPIIVTTTVAWRIKNPYQFNRTCGSMNVGAERLRTLVRNDQKTAISKYDFNNFVSTNPGELKYEDIERQILSEVQGKAESLYGVSVENIGMERLALPQRITETVFEAMKKERQALVAQYESTGNAQAAAITARAEGIARTITGFADRKASEIENEGRRAANQYYKVFQQDPELAAFLIKVENLPKLLKEKMTTIVLDQNSSLLDVFFGGTPATQPAPSLAGEDQKNKAAAGAAPVLPELNAGRR